MIDMDRIALALTTEDTPHHEYGEHIADVAIAARWAAMDRAIRSHRSVGGFDLWIIHAYPDDKDLAIYRRAGASVIGLDVDDATLRSRATAERPERVRRLLDERLEASKKHAFSSGKTHEKTCVFRPKTALFAQP